jgi:hypothetical protein
VGFLQSALFLMICTVALSVPTEIPHNTAAHSQRDLLRGAGGAVSNARSQSFRIQDTGGRPLDAGHCGGFHARVNGNRSLYRARGKRMPLLDNAFIIKYNKY